MFCRGCSVLFCRVFFAAVTATECSGVVVRRSVVADEQLTGRVGYMLLIDNTLREVPLAEIKGKYTLSERSG